MRSPPAGVRQPQPSMAIWKALKRSEHERIELVDSGCVPRRLCGQALWLFRSAQGFGFSDDVQCRRDADHRVAGLRSEEHTSELQSRENLVCRLLLEKKKEKTYSGQT